MSFRDCFERAKEDCDTDNACVLEYDADQESASCVPRLDLVGGMELSDDDLALFRTILIRLLPPDGPTTPMGKTRVAQALANMFVEMKPRIDKKIRRMGENGHHRSWQSLVATVAADLIQEIEEYECSICIEEINNAPRDTELSGLSCDHIYHRSCLKSWLRQGQRSCPSCRREISRERVQQITGMMDRIDDCHPLHYAFLTYFIVMLFVSFPRLLVYHEIN